MATSSDVAFEVFVKRAVTTIQKEAWGRNSVELRAACTSFLQTLEQHEAGVPFEGSLSVLVLQPLALACATTSSPKVAELALGCLHKLVSHAWLYGESSLFESLMDDGSDVVTQVIRMVVKCGEMPGESLQLQVVQALLTFTTAEHFVAHGDCLMAAVRTVFNLALGADAEIIKRTAGGALLQILNTVVKRITSNMHHVGDNQADGADNAADNTSGAATAASPQRAGRLPRATAGDAPAANGGHAPPPTMRSIARTTSGELHPQAEAQAHVRSCIAGSTPATGGGDLRAGGEPGELASDARTAQFASMAEQRDLRGLEEAIGASSDNLAADAAAAAAGGGGANDDDGGAADGGGDHPHAEGRPSLDRVGSGGAGGGSGGGMPPRGAAEPGGSGGGGAGTSVARTSDSSGGARAPLGAAQQGGAPFGYPGGQQRRMQSLTSLSVMERDVLHVLTAFCKLASRESGLTDVEAYLHQGKLLALELITKVLHNPQHSWVHVRDEFCRHLRQPLCITLLRNCSTTDAPAFALAIKLLVTVMMKRKLRTMLKAELGAFYPLFVLRPLELGRQDLPTLHTVLVAIRPLCAEPQLLVDLFVNYDCDLQAPCLYERTIASLSRLAHLTDAGLESRPHQMGKVQEQARRIELVRSEALRSALSVVGVLKEWASPIREALEARQAAQAQQALLAAAATAPTDEDDPRTTGPGGYGGAALTREPEVERFEAAHSHKASLARGLMMINVKPIKGIQYLLSRGLIPGDQSPASIAAFLRAHISELSKTALGELFGEHDDFSIAIMHAWVDSAPGSWAGVPIDSALRLLLEQFRLPGEAQKIDRIMEKFAERYVIDNPGRVATADGAYVLAFSIIMLNTDAHNPLAERRLAKSNFVEMNTAQVMLPPTGNERGGAAAALGAWEPVLPIEELHAIYDRIQVAEIKVREDRLAPAPVAAAASSNPSFGTQPQRLAAALGLRSLAAHFTPLARGWRRAQEALPDAERKRQLVKLAERAVLSHSGTQSGLWYTSTHSEHARPMLSVCGGGLLEALTVCLAGAKTPGEFQPLLSAIVTLSELSALLGLDELCEACVGALSKVASVRKPAAYGAQEEAKKQLAALQALLALAASPIAGLLGSGWAVLLRAAAELDALTASLAAGSSTQVLMPGDQFDDDNSLVSASSSFDQPPVSALTKMWQIMGLSTPAPGAPGGSTGSAVARSGPSVGFTLLTVPPRAPAAAATGAAVKGGARGASVAGGASAGGAVVRRMTQAAAPSALRRDAGASLALWGLGPGHDVIEIVYGASAQLDGEEVVSFFRALCTVSREELEAPGTRPRLYSLQRLLDCAAANAPTRIRLIRSKLWAVCSAHLIMASCHAAPSVAQYSVNALFGLSAQLLARAAAGLAHFTQQEEALRPFVSVLRVCDEPEIRRLAVRCAVGAAGKHVTGLGSGWRTMLELLRRGGCDPNSGVVTEALAALSGAVAALYRRNTSNSNRNSSNSSNSGASRGAIVGGRGGAAPVGKAGPGAGVTISAAAAAGAKADSGWAAGGSHRYMVEAVGACLAVGTNATQPVHVGLSALALLVVCGDRLAEHHARLAAAAQARQHQQQQQYAEGMASALAPYDSARDHVPATSPDACWALLLTQLGDWAGSDARQPVAEAASQAVLDMMQAHGHLWGGAAWQVLLARAVPRLLRARAATGGATPGFVARAADAFPGLANQLTVVPPAVRGELLRQLVCAVTEWLGMAGGDNGGDGGEAGGDTVALGLRCLEDLAGRLAEEGDAAGWQVLLDALSTPVASEIASLSEALLQSSGAGDGGCDGDGGWPEAGEEGGAGGDDGSALRARAVLLLSLLRVLTDLQASRCAAMPWGVSARLAVLLVSCAGAAGDANEEMEARAAAAGAAAARLALGGGARAQGPSASLAPPHPAPPPPTTTVAERFGIPELSPTPSQTASNLADDILGHSEASAGAAAAHPAGAPHPGQPHHHSHNHHPHGAGGDASVVVSAGWARDGSGACLLLGRLEAELTGAALDVLDACCVRERAGAGAAGGGVYGGAVTSGAGGVGGRLPEWAGAEVAAAAGAGPSQLLASFALGLVTRAAREAAAAAAASAARHSISGHAADAPPPPPPLAPWTAQLRAGHAARSLRTYASLALTGDVTTVASSTSGSGSSGSGGASMRRAGEHAASAVSQLAPLCCALVASPHGRLRIAAADFFDAHAGPFALAAAAGGPVSVGVAQAGGGDVVRRRVMALSSASGSGGGSNLADDDDNLA